MENAVYLSQVTVTDFITICVTIYVICFGITLLALKCPEFIRKKIKKKKEMKKK